MRTAHLFHTATLLPDGKVLVAGGGLAEASAELYDPRSGSWTATGSMNEERSGSTATLLRDGKVLVVLGASAELYDPASGTWTRTANMNAFRSGHTATLLRDGKVLVAGGAGEGGQLASAELYDPSSGSWTATGSLHAARSLHTAALLPDGTLLVAGGNSSNVDIQAMASAELYDPSSGSWTTTANMSVARAAFLAALLPDGKVLVAGTDAPTDTDTAARSAELYDPVSGTWTATGAMIEARFAWFQVATVLHDGKVLVAGGRGILGDLASAELYDPRIGTWTATANMIEARNGHTATLLPDGRVLVAGGEGDDDPLASAELYDPGSGT
jgi:hypothetical protein